MRGCRKKYFLPETACPRCSGDHHESRHAVTLHFLVEDWSIILICDGATAFFSTCSLEENLRNPVKPLQLCGEYHQKLKSQVFSIFGQGILEMMKGFSYGERPRTDVLAGPGPEGCS